MRSSADEGIDKREEGFIPSIRVNRRKILKVNVFDLKTHNRPSQLQEILKKQRSNHSLVCTLESGTTCDINLTVKPVHIIV